MNDAVLMIAARMPVAGETKTRLGRRVGMVEAARIYAGFLRDIADRLVPAVRAAGVDVVWTFSPPETDFAAELLRLGIDTTGVKFLPQSGSTWAARQDNLMRWAADSKYGRSVLIASDSPQLPESSVVNAVEALLEHDVVLGRVTDGGYYLIGMAGYHDVLLNVPMSTASAAEALSRNVISQGRSIAELPETFDVDEREDLDALIASLSPDGGDCPATWRVLKELGFV